MSASLHAATNALHGPVLAISSALRDLRSRWRLRAARLAADAELLRWTHAPLRLAWRADELVSAAKRLELSDSLRQLVRTADPSYLPNASPLNRVAVRAESERLLALAGRLSDLSRPVEARGIVMLERLLVDSDDPLYAREREDELAGRLDDVMAALEGTH